MRRYNILYKFRYNRFPRFKIKTIIIIIILMIGVIMISPHFFRSTYTVTIANKRIVRSNNVDTYLIYTQTQAGNIRIFKDANSLMEFKIRSADVYWGVIINRKYKIKAYGFSIPIISSYQNIINIKGVN